MEDRIVFESIQETPGLQPYTFEYLQNPYELFGKLRKSVFNGIIMPLEMASINGFEVASFLRADDAMDTVSIFLIHNSQDNQSLYLKALQLKGITWLTHPLMPDALKIHLKLLETNTLTPLGANSSVDDTLFKLGELEIDMQRYEFRLKNQPIQLTPIEFKLLKLFIERKGRIQTREHLLNTIWGYTSDIESRTIDTHVRRLREKLQDEAKRIQTVRGVGYKLIEDN